MYIYCAYHSPSRIYHQHSVMFTENHMNIHTKWGRKTINILKSIQFLCKYRAGQILLPIRYENTFSF